MKFFTGLGPRRYSLFIRQTSRQQILGAGLLIVACGVLLTFNQSAPVVAIRGRIVDTLAPIIEQVNRPFLAFSAFLDGGEKYIGLTAKVAALESENQRLGLLEQEVLALRADNESLRKEHHVSVTAEKNFVTAKVLMHVNVPNKKVVLISAGEHQGVRIGDAVVNDRGVVGRILEVSPGNAQVLLVTDPLFRLPVVSAITGDEFVLAGSGDTHMDILHIREGADVDTGDELVTSGNGGVFPPGIFVGEIDADGQGAPFVMPPVDVPLLNYVRVLTRK